MDPSTSFISSLTCPLSLKMFQEPVLAEDGQTYERDAIIQYLQKQKTSPVTNQPLSIENLRPNPIVKKLVAQFESDIRAQKYQFELNADVTITSRLFQAFGKIVYLAEWVNKQSNRPKIILLKILGTRAIKEASFYVELSRHPHIVRTYGFVKDTKQQPEIQSIMLLQEYAPKGDFLDIVESSALAESVLGEIFVQIADAMIYLVHNDVVHGDLACRNVLVFHIDNENPTHSLVKLTDFGLSRGSAIYSPLSPTSSSTLLNVVPVRYAAPEVLANSQCQTSYSEKSDVFSMGVLMWEAYSRGSIPWRQIETDEDVSRLVISGKRLEQPTRCSDNYWTIISHCMSERPQDRPKFINLHRNLLQFLFEKRLSVTVPLERNDNPIITADISLHLQEHNVGDIYTVRSLQRPANNAENVPYQADEIRNILKSSNGVGYEGELKDDKLHGRGVSTLLDGRRYEGEFKDGKLQGLGVYTKPDGKRYEGEFKDGKRHGRGVYTWPDGRRYEGEFKDGKLQERGVYTKPDGTRYEGEFKHGKLHERGVDILPDA
ncbi:unnamed protein product [Didymodactylos carnosus]|uniref:Non-specific protein-tyrosine kinase n=1 Tax=Didymodactylos carnosus TaxID=1234261 RepID=A0A815GXX1_9BILA|nr:unnamed protein product [Didymodactylos carnosus]CAF4209558.1 unnamed protein product [Didymodactylos carnosus]